jgi:hypothetical protein
VSHHPKNIVSENPLQGSTNAENSQSNSGTPNLSTNRNPSTDNTNQSIASSNTIVHVNNPSTNPQNPIPSAPPEVPEDAFFWRRENNSDDNKRLNATSAISNYRNTLDDPTASQASKNKAYYLRQKAMDEAESVNPRE